MVLESRWSFCVLLKDTLARALLHRGAFPDFENFSGDFCSGQQASYILPLPWEDSVEISIKSDCCWITDDLTVETPGYINALGADCHI